MTITSNDHLRLRKASTRDEKGRKCHGWREAMTRHECREQAKRITELENRIEALEAKIKETEMQETAKGLLTDTGAIG